MPDRFFILTPNNELTPLIANLLAAIQAITPGVEQYPASVIQIEDPKIAEAVQKMFDVAGVPYLLPAASVPIAPVFPIPAPVPLSAAANHVPSLDSLSPDLPRCTYCGDPICRKGASHCGKPACKKAAQRAYWQANKERVGKKKSGGDPEPADADLREVEEFEATLGEEMVAAGLPSAMPPEREPQAPFGGNTAA